MIELSGVTKRYGTTVVVDGVDLRLAAGGITSIVGANGAGKSTLLAMLARLLPADAGRIVVSGLDVARCDSRELARRIAILKQENHLDVRLRVRDLVSFGRYPHSQGRLGARDDELIASAIAYMDLDDIATRFIDELSGGQRQRAFVAMVLAQDSRYVLLDEPLNNLDMAHTVAMLRRLRQAANDLGKTIVMVVHDINIASCWSDHIVAMKHGRVVAHGEPAAVVTPDLLRDAFGIEAPVSMQDGIPIAQFYLRNVGVPA